MPVSALVQTFESCLYPLELVFPSPADFQGHLLVLHRIHPGKAPDGCIEMHCFGCILAGVQEFLGLFAQGLEFLAVSLGFFGIHGNPDTPKNFTKCDKEILQGTRLFLAGKAGNPCSPKPNLLIIYIMKNLLPIALLPLLTFNLIADREGSRPPEQLDPRLEALLNRAFDKEQARIFKGSDKDKDGSVSKEEFKRLYGEGGSQKFMGIFEKGGGSDGSLTLAEFQAVRRAIHIEGAGSPERKPSVQNRFKYSKMGKQFRSYDKSGDGKVTLAEYGRMFEGRMDARKEGYFKAADKDGNSSLDKYEFLEMRLGPARREGGGGKSPEAGKGRRDGEK